MITDLKQIYGHHTHKTDDHIYSSWVTNLHQIVVANPILILALFTQRHLWPDPKSIAWSVPEPCITSSESYQPMSLATQCMQAFFITPLHDAGDSWDICTHYWPSGWGATMASCFTTSMWCGSMMMTSSIGNILHVTGPLCREFIGHQWIPLTKASDVELWCFFYYLCLKKRLSKQSIRWWFEMPSHSL